MHLSTWYRRVSHTSMAPVRWAAAWARITFFGSVMVVRALSPRSYGPQTRYNLARHVYVDTAPILGWFTVLATAHDAGDEDVDEVFWFTKHRAAHPALPLDAVLVVHIASRPRKEEIETAYADA